MADREGRGAAFGVGQLHERARSEPPFAAQEPSSYAFARNHLKLAAGYGAALASGVGVFIAIRSYGSQRAVGAIDGAGFAEHANKVATLHVMVPLLATFICLTSATIRSRPRTTSPTRPSSASHEPGKPASTSETRRCLPKSCATSRLSCCDAG